MRQLNGAVGAAAAKTAAASAKMAASHTASMGQMAGSTVTVLNPLEKLNQSIQRGNLTVRSSLSAWAQRDQIIRQNIANMKASGMATTQLNGKIKVLMSTQAAHSAVIGMATQKLRLLNTLLLASAANMIKFGKQVQWAGRQIQMGIGLPLLLLSAVANKAAEGYIKEMTRVVKVTTLTAAANTEAFRLQEESIRRQTMALTEFGASMGFAAAETANLVAQFAQMGFAGDALNYLSEAALTLSRVSGATLEDSIQLTRLAYSAYGVELDELTNTYARLNLIENNTSLSLADLAKGLPIVAGVAKTVGLSIEETSGFLAIMRDNGISANEGATALRTGLIRIVSEATDPSIRAFDAIGISLTDLKERMQEAGGDIMIFFREVGEAVNAAAGDQAKLNEIVAAVGKLVGVRQAARFMPLFEELPEALDAIEVAQKAFEDAIDAGQDYVTAFQSVRVALEAANIDPDAKGVRGFIGVWAEQTAATAQFERELNNVQTSAAGVAERLRAEIGVELIRIGELTLELTNRLREFALGIARWFNSLSEGTRKSIIGVSAFFVAFGTGIMLFGVFLNALGNVISLLGAMLPKFQIVTAAMSAEKIAQDGLAAATSAANVAKARQIQLNQQLVASSTAAAGAAQLQAAGQTVIPPGTTTLPLAGRGAGAAAGNAAGAASSAAAGNTSKIAGLMGKISKLPGILLNIVKLSMKFIGIFGVVLGIIAIVKAGISDWGAFMDGFREKSSGAIESLRNTIAGFVQMLRGMFEEVTRAFGGAEGASKGLGSVLGSITAFITWIVERIVKYLMPPIINIAGVIGNLFAFIIKFFTGDMAAAEQAFVQMWERIKQIAIDAIVGPIRGFLEVLAEIPGTAEWANNALAKLPMTSGAIAEAAGEALQKYKEQNDAIEDQQTKLDYIVSKVNEAQRIQDELIASDVIRSGYRLAELKDSAALTDEQYNQLVYLEVGNRIREELEANLTEQRLTMERIVGLELDLIQGKIMEAEAQRQINALVAHQRSLSTANLAILDRMKEEIKNLSREVSVVPEYIDDMNDGLDEANEELQEAVNAANELKNALKSAMGEVMGDITSAVKEALNRQMEAVKKHYDDLESETSEYFASLEENIDSQTELLLDQIDAQYEMDKKRIEDTAKSELSRIQDIEDREKEVEKQRQRFFAAEKARIDFLSGKQIASLDIGAALASGDTTQAARLRIQQEAATRKFVADTMSSEEDVLAERRQRERDALRDAIEEQKNSALELIETNRDAARESVEIARDRYKEEIRIAREAAMQQIEIARNAAIEAAELEARRIENYLREWQRITPRTEEEFRNHLNNLLGEMDTSSARFAGAIGIINNQLANGMTEISSLLAENLNGITVELGNSLGYIGEFASGVLQEISNLTNSTLQSLLENNNMFSGQLSSSFSNSSSVVNSFFDLFERRIQNAFSWAERLADKIIAENRRWADDAVEQQDRVANNLTTNKEREQTAYNNHTRARVLMDNQIISSSQRAANQFDRTGDVAEDAGIRTENATIGPISRWEMLVGRIRDAINNAVQFITSGLGGAFAMGFGPAGRAFHSGGMVGKMSSSRDIPATLQSGEYVINRDAVRSFGPKFFDSINSMKAGSSFVKTPRPPSIRMSEKSEPAQNVSTYNLSFNIDGGKIDESRLAERVIFEIKKVERNRGEGRSIRPVRTIA